MISYISCGCGNHLNLCRMNYTRDKIDWADIVMPTGGDGTFLLAASLVQSNRKPVVGFNSVPETSEGYLCLPKHFSNDIKGAVQRILTVSVILKDVWRSVSP